MDGNYYHYFCEVEMESSTHGALHVSIDVGCYHHHVAVGLSDGSYLGGFEIDHNREGFDAFFKQIEHYRSDSNGDVSVAMEGYNGHARPLDQLIQSSEYDLYNINNLKLARFKEVFPGAAKTDPIDTRKGLELFQLQQTLPIARNVLQAVPEVPVVHRQLKQLTRRRNRLVDERVSYLNTLQSDLRALSPGLVEITGKIKNTWFINFLASTKDLRLLARKRKSSLLKIPRVGKKYAGIIQSWQSQAVFSNDAEFAAPGVYEDVCRIQHLSKMIKQLEKTIEEVSTQSSIACRLRSMEKKGSDKDGETTPFGKILLNDKFKNCLSLDQFIGLLDTLLHEGMHASDGYWQRQRDSRAQPKDTPNHEEIGIRARWEIGFPILQASEGSKNMMGRRNEVVFSAKMWGLGTVTMTGDNRNPNGLFDEASELYNQLYQNGCECGN